MLSIKDGSVLVKATRKTIESCLKTGSFGEVKGFSQKAGVFVTLLIYSSRELRGCIGFPYATLPLGKAVCEAAKAAAFCDPRFPQLNENELSKIIIEVSILTKPEEIRCSKAELCKKVIIGRDGLIVNFHESSGLLLPQVAVEWKWNSQEFIEHACIKTGLPANIWNERDCKLYKFQAQIFAEEKPDGDIIEKQI